MEHETQADVLKRLAYIEGHLSGVRRMIESDQYCVDVLKQTFAIRRCHRRRAVAPRWTREIFDPSSCFPALGSAA